MIKKLATAFLDDKIGVADFDQFMKQNWTSMVALAWRLLGERASAEDIAQQAFLRAWQAMPSLKRKTASAWLRKVVYNLAIDHIRKHHKLQPMADEVIEHMDGKADTTLMANPEMQLMARHEVNEIEKALSQLNERQRYAICLYYYEDLKLNEIAKLMDMSIDAVESLIRRARQKLKPLLTAIN